MKIRVVGEFAIRESFGEKCRNNIVYPMNPGHPVTADQRWSMTCDKPLSAGTLGRGPDDPTAGGGIYQGTYDKATNKIELSAKDVKGKEIAVKCEMFSHDWRQPPR